MRPRHALTLLAVFVSSLGCDDNDNSGSSHDSDTDTHAHPGGGSHDGDDAGSTHADAGSTHDEDGGAATSQDTDYGKPDNWLCRPGHNGACDVNLDSTIVKADGSLEIEPFKAKADAPIDCFYVYPTVSLDATPNSDLVPGAEENSVVRAQFARFASQCRLFAPMYRQVTLTALRASIAGMSSGADQALGYRDVAAAWHYYLEHDNKGRGVVLIGHSQGSGVLSQLLKEQLDKKPGESRFITALLLGTVVTVPKDAVVGGTFTNLPLCKANDELGCVIVYASFRSNTPPSETTNFASSKDPALEAGCTNPAALSGGSAPLHAYLSTNGPGSSAAPMPAWVDTGATIDTPFVSVPGLLSAECLFAHTGWYLSITVHGDPTDHRVDDIVGDVVTNGEVQADWGLHLIDPNLAMGNLLDVVQAKAKAYLAH